MNRQIEEIKKLAETLQLIDEFQFNPNYTPSYQRAICLNKAGYRKQSDVAMEIFEEILKIKGLTLNDWLTIAELRKKYESED